VSDESPLKRDEATYSIDPVIHRTIKVAASQVNVSVSVEPGDAVASAADTIHEMDDFDLESFVPVAAGYGQDRFGFVVTPNVDHLIRFHEDATYRGYCRSAQYVLLDSRFASRLVQLIKGVKLRVCTGSDLTAALFSRVIRPSDRIVLIGGSHEQAQRIAGIYGLQNVCHYNPPMGFIKNAAAVEQCLEFIETQSPFRFCFLAVGCPQQEALAEALKRRGKARGLALCVGASLNFIVGSEKRAPMWMQKLSIEWLYRLIQDPRRLAGRYLVRGPRFFSYLRRARFVPRSASARTAA
jgi:exopolysaccharide biosynthesis WecB/TagA/CpsF family protein